MNFQVSDVLTVRTWVVKDAPELFALVEKNRRELTPWLPWVPNVQKVADSERFIIDSQSDIEKNKSLELGIFYQNQLAGCIGLHDIDATHHKASIGYWLGSHYQGQGIMTQCVEALVQYCFCYG